MSEGIRHSIERKSFEVIVNGLLNKVGKAENKRDAYIAIADLAGRLGIKELSPEAIEMTKSAFRDPDNRWACLFDDILEHTDRNVAKQTLLNLGYEAFLNGTKTIRRNREIYGCNIPWLILFDPTQACNMHCAGCWSGTYGK